MLEGAGCIFGAPPPCCALQLTMQRPSSSTSRPAAPMSSEACAAACPACKGRDPAPLPITSRPVTPASRHRVFLSFPFLGSPALVWQPGWPRSQPEALTPQPVRPSDAALAHCNVPALPPFAQCFSSLDNARLPPFFPLAPSSSWPCPSRKRPLPCPGHATSPCQLTPHSLPIPSAPILFTTPEDVNWQAY